MQGIDEKRNKRKNPRLIVLVCLLVIVLLISFGEPLGIPTWQEVYTEFGIDADLGEDLSLSFFDVGSADSCYITCNGKNILIDSGYASEYDKISSYLYQSGCTHFDALIVSHPDRDHIGGFKQIIEDYGANELYLHNPPYGLASDNSDYSELINSASENNVAIYDVQSDMNVSIGDMDFQFIVPTKEYKNTNDNSMLVKITYYETEFLFTGDISKQAETDYIDSGLDLQADVMKVAHHGSKTSACEEFIREVNPEIAIVSTAGEEKGNASYETMYRLNELCSEVYRTDKDGDIVLTCDGENIEVQTNAKK